MKLLIVLVILQLILQTFSELRNELVLKDPKEVGEHVVTKQPYLYLKAGDLPAELDYRKLGLLTTDLNQHIPTYCGNYTINYLKNIILS